MIDQIKLTVSLALEQIFPDGWVNGPLAYMVFLSPHGMSDDLLKHFVSSAKELKTELDKPVNLSLVKLGEFGVYSMHNLTQQAIRNCMRTDSCLNYLDSVCEILAKVVKTQDPNDLNNSAFFRSLVPHWKSVMKHIDEYQLNSEATVEMLNQAGYFCCTYGLYAESQFFLEKALTVSTEIFNSRQWSWLYTAHADTLTNLAGLYFKLENYPQTESFLEKALDSRVVTRLGGYDGTNSRVLQNLETQAGFYYHQRKQELGDSYAKHAHKIIEDKVRRVLEDRDPHRYYLTGAFYSWASSYYSPRLFDLSSSMPNLSSFSPDYASLLEELKAVYYNLEKKNDNR
jgi:tetratricopeptide (TPR) repeat protein